MRFLVLLTVMMTGLFACTNVFINKGGFHIVARSMDFGLNMGLNQYIGYIGQKNTTDIVVDAKNIPQKAILSWKNKYGFFGRSAFNTPIIVDGMNTQGLSVALLYNPGSKDADYNPKDKRKALSVYNLSYYLLSQAKNIKEAKELIEKVQIVKGAVEAGDGMFLTNIPIHYVVRDRSGNSMVIEFENKKLKLYEGKDIVMTNAPMFSWQKKNAAKYKSLRITNKKPNPEFENRVINYNEIYNNPAMRAEQTALMGLPADYTPPSRFVRVQVLVNNMSAPKNRAMAQHQAESILNSAIVPPLSTADVTEWTTIQDLDELKFMVKDLYYYNPDHTLYAFDLANGYKVYDLKNLNFNTIPVVGAPTLKVTPPKDVKKIIDGTKAFKSVGS